MWLQPFIKCTLLWFFPFIVLIDCSNWWPIRSLLIDWPNQQIRTIVNCVICIKLNNKHKHQTEHCCCGMKHTKSQQGHGGIYYRLKTNSLTEERKILNTCLCWCRRNSWVLTTRVWTELFPMRLSPPVCKREALTCSPGREDRSSGGCRRRLYFLVSILRIYQ